MRWAVWALALAGAGCGQFGLPTGRADGDIQRGDPTVLDIDPKVGSLGTEELAVAVSAIDTFFDSSTQAALPDLPEVDILEVDVTSLESLTLVLSIPEDAPTGSSPLQITTERDGVLIYEAGFTVVP